MIHEEYLMANGTYTMNTMEDSLTITNKGRKVIHKYEQRDKYTPAKKFAYNVGVNVTSEAVIAILSALLTVAATLYCLRTHQ